MAKGCCSTTCLKNALNFFNLIFLFVALGLIAVTIWNLYTHSELIDLLTSMTYSALLKFLLVSGALLIMVSFLGCYAVIKENRKFLIIYIFLLLLIILIEFMVAILGFIYRETVNDELKSNLNSTLLDNYGVDPDKTKAIDIMQQEFLCCGAIQFDDWKYSVWRTSNMTNNLVPDSCCKTISVECGVRDHPSNINDRGCLDTMEKQMKSNLIILISVGLGVGLSQVIGIILAVKLYLQLKKDDIDINELRRILHHT